MAAKRSPETDSPQTGSGQRDYYAEAVAYARKAIADKRRQFFGKWIRLAAQRFINDLKRAKSKDCAFYFSAWHAHDVCDFIEKLPHVEGKWKNADGTDQDYIVLHESQVFFLVNLFGFRKRTDHSRRFTTALYAIARKNAKSTLAGAISLYCFCCEPERGPQVISAATTGSQARIIFKIAKRMVEQTGDLREAFTLAPFANAIARYEVGGEYKPINSKASTQDGLNPSHCFIDEVHAHKDHDLLNVLRSAAGARSSPLFLYTTTEGYETPGPWPEIRHFAKQLLERLIEADHFLAVIYALDDEEGKPGEPDYRPADGEFDESTWIKANPLMMVNPLLLDEIRKEAIEAKVMPGRHAEFKIKRCNRQSATATGWLNLTKWRSCGGVVNLDELVKYPCWGGLDLASVSDLTAFRLVWKVGDKYVTWGVRWVPAEAIKQRTVRGAVPYAGWVDAGYIKQTDGNVCDYAVVEQDVRALWEKFKPQSIAFDGWNASDLVSRLPELPMIQFVQGTKSYHPAMKELERAYTSGNFVHGDDPVLTWCASNLVARYDVNLNTAPDKRKSKEKIDDMTALFMAIGVSITPAEDAMPEIQQGFVVIQ